jgi:hypothetical protein
MAPSRTLSIWIDQPFAMVYEFLADPRNYPTWASGLGESIRQEGGQWIAEAPQGPVKVRFSAPNFYGVLDHYVTLPDGAEIYLPMRLLERPSGCELTFTLFRQAGVTDDAFEADAAWVERDLAALKQLLEAE